MLIVGLTGGMGSGKTTVSRMFEELGVPVYNSDREARRLMQQEAGVRERITKLFGKEAYKDGVTNRAYIASKVFADQDLLNQLNAIVHPEVGADFQQWRKNKTAPYVIQEAAIIFENGSYTKFDKIILVTAPKELRIERILERDGTNREAITARMAHQWDDSQKAPLSDFLIVNIDLEKTRKRVGEIHQQLLKISG